MSQGVGRLVLAQDDKDQIMEVMMSVVQMETKKVSSSGYSKMPKHRAFLLKAYGLLKEAQDKYDSEEYDAALESAYRCALRVAGAKVSLSRIARRSRKPQSAWLQLQLVDDVGREWAKKFSAYSRIRSRVASGMEYGVSPLLVEELMALVRDFLWEVEYEAGELMLAA
ncbi:hypothetical protein EML15_02200 [Corynebacterium sp. sy017]|uniref:SAV_6107 family HEPN domain-containing protein n=1 Tax=unclassified Corynebacterium TaxID=2624378 RepID=UPI00118489D2|nr:MULTISPECIES: SAV_6107 family HEPN domain-containing protein [unclassified Corynebacterium]MBP3087969.1 hypothetical protein [Corynebacterium sp. sy017]TSD92500.1 hypothetical protein ELY17_02200 [Corynebacterium sp. SY003]